jgi:galactokinase
MSDAAPVRGRVVAAFERRFGASPEFVARAPGRVNLIGDHTDYNDGFVLPMAIDRAVWIALRSSPDGRVRVESLDFDERAEFDPDALPGQRNGVDGQGWSEYIRGVAWALRGAGLPVRGWDGVVAGDVPLGAGLSSSAALELAAMAAFAATGQLTWEPAKMARLAQRAENGWVGVNCGIMDQLISAAGRAEHALLIDCRSLQTRAVPLPDDVAVVVLDTATRRGLVDSAYNERRRQCEVAASFFGVRVLRDVDEAVFAAQAAGLDGTIRRRARHVITENARTIAAADSLAVGDVTRVGQLMNESHESLRSDFEVSRRELDVVVDLASRRPECLGARMTGAGFGGCAVALVIRDEAKEFARAVARDYESAVGLRPALYVCTASRGASLERPLGSPA